MYELRNGNTLTSNEVAGMLEIEHSDLLKKISKINESFAQGKITLCDFWIKSSYVDKNNRLRKNYNITKKGCEFLANKTTGSKGNIFTALYVNKFNEMEKEQKPKELSTLDILQLATKEIEKLSTELQETKVRNNDLTGVLTTIQTYGDNVLFREFVKIIYNEENIKITEKDFRQMLIDEKYLMTNLYPYAKYMKYFNVNKGVKNKKAWTTTRLTAKGQLYFTNKLLKMFE